MKAISALIEAVLDNWKILMMALILLMVSGWAVANCTGHGLSVGGGCGCLSGGGTPSYGGDD